MNKEQNSENDHFTRKKQKNTSVVSREVNNHGLSGTRKLYQKEVAYVLYYTKTTPQIGLQHTTLK